MHGGRRTCSGAAATSPGELGLTALIRRLATAPDEWSLRPDRDGWLLRAGQEHARLTDSRGVRQLRTLLASPQRDIRALDLAAGGSGLRAPAAPSVLDAAAAASYRRRLGDLTAELDAADAAGDSGCSRSCAGQPDWAGGPAAPPLSPNGPE
jgi:hypothetical protein